MKGLRNKKGPAVIIFGLILFLGLGWSASVWAERLELVTYYPAPIVAGGANNDPGFDTIRVGPTYKNPAIVPIPTPGTALIEEKIGLGTSTPASNVRLHVKGIKDIYSTVALMPGDDTVPEVPEQRGDTALRLGIGTTTPESLLQIVDEMFDSTTPHYSAVKIDKFNATGDNQVSFRRTNVWVGQVPQDLTSGQSLGTLGFYGYPADTLPFVSTKWFKAVKIRAATIGSGGFGWTSTSRGGQLQIETVLKDDPTFALDPRLCIDGDGEIGIWTFSPNARLDMVNLPAPDGGNPMRTGMWFQMAGTTGTPDAGKIWMQYGDENPGAGGGGAPFIVLSDLDNTPIIQFQMVGTGTEAVPQNLCQIGGGGSNLFMLAGNIGMGTRAPNRGAWTGRTVTIEDTSNEPHIEMAYRNDALADNVSLGAYSWFAGTAPTQVAKIESRTFGTSENAGHIAFFTKATTDTAPVERMRIISSGRVGIGTASPSTGWALDVAGNIRCVSLTQTSDGRLKSEIQPLNGVLEKLEKIHGISFEWNKLYESVYPSSGRSLGEREIGVLAQEVEQVFPELVRSGGEKSYLGVDYGGLTAVLLEAVKELKAENESLKAHNNDLERRIETIENQLK